MVREASVVVDGYKREERGERACGRIKSFSFDIMYYLVSLYAIESWFSVHCRSLAVCLFLLIYAFP